MAVLAPTPPEHLVDERNRPYFLWDADLALADRPRQDGGFSPLTFSWAVKGTAIEKLARTLAWGDDEIASIVRFRDELVDRVVAAAHP